MTWNPTTGCNKISDGCKFCYAEIMAERLKSIGVEKYANGFNLTIHADELRKPYSWKTPEKIFVNSMSDLFHKNVPVDFIQKVFTVIKENPRHIFQILTKRADVLLDYDKKKLLEWTHNLWMGVTVENEKVMERINLLRQTDAKTKFLSCEPLLSPLPNLNLEGIDLVIVGGESGKTPRPMKEEWVMGIKEQCEKNKVAFFFKQWGGTNKKKTGNLLNGKKYLEMPKLEEKYCGPLWAQQL
ncbi:phage Gp37/Gp68 family protein [bacterium]|nr:phage Gp37/Gp68 family protein [bacterium]